VSIDSTGFEIIENVLSVHDSERLLASLNTLKLEPLRGGIRRIEQMLPDVAALTHSPQLLRIAEGHLPGQPNLVRAIYFNKSPDNNWLVTWHQDRTVAVSERFDMDGWGPWSRKAGVWHVQPPIQVLEQMITLRVHLDAATAANGCLKILPGSHHMGLLASHAVSEKIDKTQAVYCEASVGGVVVMRPHVLHASEKSTTSAQRRVLHFEYSSFQLPAGIAWAA